MTRRWLRPSLIGGALALAGFAMWWAWKQHPGLFSPRYNLTVATGPLGSEGQQFLAAFNRDLAVEHPLVRLTAVPTDNLAHSGKALTGGEVDLALVRSDDAAAAVGRTILMLRRIGIAVLLPPESKVEAVSGLASKKLAVAKTAHHDPGLLKAFTEFYGLRETDLVELALPQLGPALKSNRVAAVVVFGPLGAGAITDAFAGIRKSFKAKPTFLDIAEAEAIAARWPAYEAVEVKQGMLGGTPPEPEEAINTFAVTVRLVSRASLPDRVAGELTRMLLATKAKLAVMVPAVGQMEAPDTEKSTLLPVHPGTLAYLNGEQATLLDESLNYYWLAAMIVAVLAPVVGWIRSRTALRRRDEARAHLLKVVELVRLAKAGSANELAGADEELDEMTEWLFGKLASGEIERDHFQCIERMISGVRSAIEKRLADLASSSSKIVAAA